MRIDHHADVDVEGISENDVRGFASDSGESGQFFHRAWDFAAMVFQKRLATRLNVFRFVAEESDSPDVVLQFFRRRVCETFRVAIFSEKIFRDDVDLFVRALRRQDGRDEQLKWIGKIQFAMRIRVGFSQTRDNVRGAFFFGLERFARHKNYKSRYTSRR